MALSAARSGLNVKGITLLQEQLAYALQRVEDANLEEQIDLSLTDCRDVSGQFDAIASIEMVEAVGEQHWAGRNSPKWMRLWQGGHAIITALVLTC
ncbi:MAG: class I SAM-dependent methyltransferase [Cohaesibacter sp.]|jgi:cyclopropane-fatty-acyl-phospholipid synthase|nr:class I SAM-dependent methyltransferase [Cohaesibacter sp.]